MWEGQNSSSERGTLMQEKNEICLKRTDSDTLNEINRKGRERLTLYSVPYMVITHMHNCL